MARFTSKEKWLDEIYRLQMMYVSGEITIEQLFNSVEGCDL